MIEKLISWSIRHPFLVGMLMLALAAGGLYAVKNTPVDAIPDLSENQVIIYTEWMGRNPQIMEDQVTYPLVANLQGIPSIKNIRASSMFGMSFIFVIFQDEVDLYWARARVLERLNYAQRLLPPGITPSLGPDGTGIGHVFWYTLEAPGYSLGELRAVQDWYVKFALQNVEGVSEVASFGGFQKQYQVAVDPHKLVYYQIPFMALVEGITRNNRDVGGSVFEMNRAGYLVKGLGYLKNKEDIENIRLAMNKSIPIRVKDVATVQMSGDLRLGIIEQNGEGEVVGGIVVMRYGENAQLVIEKVKQQLLQVEKGLPPGVTFRIAYDRSELILAAIATLRKAITEEIVVVSVVVLLFLFHWGGGLVAILNILFSVLIAFMLMQLFGVTSNIMSLGGVALAVGDLVDSGIVMVENAYKQLTHKVLQLDDPNPDQE